MTFSGIPSALPLISGGKLKVIAVSTLKRASLLPEIPTLSTEAICHKALRRKALDFHFHMAAGGLLGIRIDASGDRFTQVILTAVFANFGGHVANNHDCIIALQGNGGSTRVSMARLANGAFHRDLRFVNASSQIIGSGR